MMDPSHQSVGSLIANIPTDGEPVIPQIHGAADGGGTSLAISGGPESETSNKILGGKGGGIKKKSHKKSKKEGRGVTNSGRSNDGKNAAAEGSFLFRLSKPYLQQTANTQQDTQRKLEVRRTHAANHTPNHARPSLLWGER